MQICPNDKFIEIFAQRFHYFEDPFYKFFALNLLFQDTSCSLPLKYSSFLFKFISFAFYNINFWFKISKICPKIRIFLKFLSQEGTLIPSTIKPSLAASALCYRYCVPNADRLRLR